MVARNPEYPLSLFHDRTTEIKNGWIFFYQSTRFIQTRDRDHFLFGNAPLIVDSRRGSVLVTGTAGPTETYITNFEETGDPHIEAVDYVRIFGCRVGANKVEATKSIRLHTELRLERSKRCINDAIDDISTDIRMRTAESAEILCRRLDELGWNCQVLRGGPKSDAEQAVPPKSDRAGG